MHRVLLVTNIPTPYRIPLFNELSKQLSSKRISLKVVFGAMGYDRRKWQVDMSECAFNYEVLPSKKIQYADNEKVSFTYTGLGDIVKQWKPSVIITNAFSFATMKLWLRSWYARTPYIIWSGAVLRKGMNDTFLRRLQRKILVRRAAGFIAYGSKSKKYLMSLGASPDKVEVAINTVDTDFFRTETEVLRNNARLKKNKKHLLYIGHLTNRKDVLKVLDVVKAMSNLRDDFLLDIVGDGDDRERLEKYVADNDLTKFVKFHGFKQKTELPVFMAIADCFLFQTDFDIWGLALVEAMAAGVPCVSSVHAGATPDLIQEGVNGFVMDFSDVEKVSEKLNWLFDNPERGGEIGWIACCFIAENVSIRKSAKGFVSSVLKTLDCREGIS